MESHPRICLGLVALPVGSVLSPFFASPDSFSSMCVCVCVASSQGGCQSPLLLLLLPQRHPVVRAPCSQFGSEFVCGMVIETGGWV